MESCSHTASFHKDMCRCAQVVRNLDVWTAMGASGGGLKPLYFQAQLLCRLSLEAPLSGVIWDGVVEEGAGHCEALSVNQIRW